MKSSSKNILTNLLVIAFVCVGLIGCDGENKKQDVDKNTGLEDTNINTGLEKGILSSELETRYAQSLSTLNSQATLACTTMANGEQVSQIYNFLKASKGWPNTSDKTSICGKIKDIQITDMKNIASNSQVKTVLEGFMKSALGDDVVLDDWIKQPISLCKNQQAVDFTKLQNFYKALKKSKGLADASTQDAMCDNLEKKLSVIEFFGLLRNAGPNLGS